MRRTFMNIIRSIKKILTWKLIFGILLAIIIANIFFSRANAEDVDEEVKLEIKNFIEQTIAKKKALSPFMIWELSMVHGPMKMKRKR